MTKITAKTYTGEISTIEFYKYFQNLLGYHFYLFIAFNFVVGVLDGLGLAMFIPLLGLATGTDTGNKSLGNLEFLPAFFENLGIPLNIVTVLIIMIGMFSLKGVLSYLRDLYFIKLRLRSIRKIRFMLIDHLRSLSYRGYTQSDPGTIQYAMVGETGRLVTAMTNFIKSIQNLIILFTYIALAFFANWEFAVLVAVGGLLSNLLYRIINKLTRSEAKKLSSIGNRFNRYLIQSIHNFKYLKATNAFSRYEKNLKTAIHDFENTQFKIGKLNAIAASLREPVIIIIISLVLIFHVQIMGGSFGGILVSLLLFYRALNYLVATQNTWNNFLGTSASLDAINTLIYELQRASEPAQHKNQQAYSEINTVELDDVSLQYGDFHVLKNIHLRLDLKQTIAFVGESGAGKSTLANVIGGLVDPNDGKILINGEELLLNQLNAYRQKIGYIAQEPVIFDDTIYNNVTFWAPKSKENTEKFNRAMKLVHLNEFLQNQPEKEDAPLGNNGVLISGGQKQRISIARELFREVDLLIMDEATSALDSETETVIKDNIASLHGEYMMVIIAHRLSTIKHADVIYLMKDGRIVNQGNYQQLYGKSEDFKRMVDLQEV